MGFDWSDDMVHVDWWVWWQKCRKLSPVKEISSFSNQLFKVLHPRQSADRRKEPWIKQGKKWHMQSVLVRLNSTTWRQTATALWLTRSHGILRRRNWPLRSICLRQVLIHLFAKPTSHHLQLRHTASERSWKAGNIKLLQDFSRVVKRAAETMIHPDRKICYQLGSSLPTNTMHTLVSWSLNAKAVLLLATQQS